MKHVSDHRSNPNDQIEHAVGIIGRSSQRLAVFKAIYHGKRKTKTVADVAKATGLTEKQVLGHGKKLSDNSVVQQTKINGRTAYTKDVFYASQKAKILRFVDNPTKLEELPTKSRPRITVRNQTTTLIIPATLIKCDQITIDDIDSFKAVRNIDSGPTTEYTPMLESQFKEGIKQILNEESSFKDWGGEPNDLLSTRVKIRSKRLTTVFAFKGRGRKGVLKPSHMGKNGDQILRLFKTPADLYVVQYWGEIDQSVYEHVRTFAGMESIQSQRQVKYCIVDGIDSTRLIAAYPDEFRGD